MQALPGWARERGEHKLREETEKYHAMSPAERFLDFIQLMQLTAIQLEASPFGARALAEREPLPAFVTRLFAHAGRQGSDRR